MKTMKILAILLTIILVLFYGMSYAKPCMYWNNFKTGEHECIDGIPDNSRFKEFLPQSAAVQNLYELYIKMGKTPLESFMEVNNQILKNIPKDEE